MAACNTKSNDAENKAGRDKVVLAYSGGLDTSVAIHWLQEKYNVDVIAIAINVGQPPSKDDIVARALRNGAIKADYIGYRVPDEFVVGYGLDYDEKYRNLPYVGVLKPEIYSE